MKLILKKNLTFLKILFQKLTGNTSNLNNSLTSYLLWLLSIVYLGIVKIRSDLYRRNLLSCIAFKCKTISIGNLVVGGTGKTPFTIYLANLIKQFDKNVVVISRGYGSSMEKKGCIVSDGNFCFKNAIEIGDEPYLIAQSLDKIPIIIGKNKIKATKEAIKIFNPDVIIFDDAFQHLKIRYNLSLVLMDSTFPFGNGFMLPRGTLREPKSALNRADTLIFTRKVETIPNIKDFNSIPQFSCYHKLVLRKTLSASNNDLKIDLRGKPVLVFSGLADNIQFHEALLKANFLLSKKMCFDDHHKYNFEDIKKILILANKTKSQGIITTDKDYTKLKLVYDFLFPIPLLVFGVDIDFGNETLIFSDYIRKFISV